MSKQLDRHDISEELYIYKQDNSERWYARIKVAGKWHAKATKKKEMAEALTEAIRIQTRLEILAEQNILVSSKRFRDVAERAIDTMQNALDKGTGAANFKNYIQVLRKYHIPFFDRTYITSIDTDKLRQFDNWRIEQFGGSPPAKSTLLNHNAAMQLVFKEAVDRKWMLAAQVPKLSTKGSETQRRAHFTDDEYDKLYVELMFFTGDSRKDKTRQIRELLETYVMFAVATGIRPGTEMENITWGDITYKIVEHEAEFYVNVKKGKTTTYTGTREIVCLRNIREPLILLRKRFPNRKPSDKIFLLEDGSTTNELSKSFDKLLKKCGLKQSPHGVRTLYSLRHTYITRQLFGWCSN